MLNTNLVMKLESDALFAEIMELINEEISDGPVTDPEDFNLMMIAMRNAFRAQKRVINNFATQLQVTP